MDCVVHGVAKSRKQLSDFLSHFPFLFACAGSLLLRLGSLQAQSMGSAPAVVRLGPSQQWPLLLQSAGSQAQQLPGWTSSWLRG